jgi:uridine kinase
MKIIGITGGSGSGKTYFAKALKESIGENECTLIFQDSYYLDQSSKFDFDGGIVNFDHPDAIEFSLITQHLIALRNQESIHVPIYDFKTHKRLTQTIQINPTPYVIVDGILILFKSEVRALFDATVFVDTSESLRYERRKKRDLEERGRTEEGIEKQFLSQVKPMHDKFVEPAKPFASFSIKEDDNFQQKLKEFQIFIKK